jgi:hypothetical protein
LAPRSPLGPVLCFASGKEEQDKLLNDHRLASAYLGRRDWTGDDFRPDFFETASSPPSVRLSRPRLLESLKAAWKAFRNGGTDDRASGDENKKQEDSDRAHQLQMMFLPKRGLGVDAWETYYDYMPVGAVGGDYCDLVAVDGSLFFFFWGRCRKRNRRLHDSLTAPFAVSRVATSGIAIEPTPRTDQSCVLSKRSCGL